MANIKRLKRLVVVLERVKADPKKRREFDMTAWAEETPGCGTHMCACGWGANDPVLSRQGLKLVRWKQPFYRERLFKLKYRGLNHMDAAAAFFGISTEDANFLFDPGEYEFASTAMFPVIKRIGQFIRGAEQAA